MKLIDKYIITRSLGPFFYCLSAFIILFIIVDLFENLDVFIKNRIDFFIILKYYLFFIPGIFSQISPIAVLLSSVYILGNLSKHNEITAMKASGINLFRIVSPFLLLGFIISLGTIILNETVIPKSFYHHTLIKEKYLSDASDESIFYRRNVAYISGKYSYYIKLYDVEKKEMTGVTVLKHDKDAKLEFRIDAQKAEWTGTGWRFYDGCVRTFNENTETDLEVFNNKFIQIPENPESFTKGVSMELMTYKDLKNYIDKLKQHGNDALKERVFLYSKISMPFANFIVLLVGIPLMIMMTSGNILTGIVFSLIVSFGFRVLSVIGISLGNGGAFPPILSAWFGNIIFICLGVWLLRRIDT